MTQALGLFAASVEYVVDASSFIDLRERYPRDVMPGAWQLIEKLAAEKRLVSVDEVFHELAVKDDEALAWAKKHRDLFLPLTSDIQAAAKEVLRTHPDLLNLKDRTSGADPFLIGTARLLDATVVTEETRTGGKPHRPHIPNVCQDLGVGCIRLLGLFRAEGLHL